MSFRNWSRAGQAEYFPLPLWLAECLCVSLYMCHRARGGLVASSPYRDRCYVCWVHNDLFVHKLCLNFHKAQQIPLLSGPGSLSPTAITSIQDIKHKIHIPQKGPYELFLPNSLILCPKLDSKEDKHLSIVQNERDGELGMVPFLHTPACRC